MNKKRHFAKTTFIIFFGKVCTQLISFFLLPLYTAFLTKKEYGIVDLIQTYVALFVPLITLELEMSVFRFLIDYRGKDADTKKLISSNFFILFSSLLVFTIIFFTVNLFIDIPFPVIIWLDIVACVFSGNFLQIARGFGKTIDFSIGSALAGITTIISNIVLICFCGMQAEGMIISMALANFICSIYLFIRLKLYSQVKRELIDFSLLKKMYSYSIPLVPNSISWWIVNVSDRTIITSVLGTGINGIYAVSNKFPTIISSLTGIFNLSWAESAALYINSKDRDKFFSDIANTIMNLFISLAVGMLACMPFVFPIMVNSKFAEAYNYIPPLVIATIFNVGLCLYNQIYLAKKLPKAVASTTMMGAIINIGINIIFVRYIGLYAAALSTMIAYFSMFIYRHFDIKKHVNIKYENYFLTKTILMFAFVLVCYYINNFYLNITSLIIAIIYAYLVNRKNLLAIIGMVFHKQKNN